VHWEPRYPVAGERGHHGDSAAAGLSLIHVAPVKLGDVIGSQNMVHVPISRDQYALLLVNLFSYEHPCTRDAKHKYAYAHLRRQRAYKDTKRTHTHIHTRTRTNQTATCTYQMTSPYGAMPVLADADKYARE
jgi:hypothetical protein